MNDLTKWQESLPEVHLRQDQLAKPLARMEYTTLLSRLATNAASDAYVYAVLKLVTTVQQADLLERSYENMPPEVEASLREHNEQYKATMEAISQQVNARLLEELERIPAGLGDGSFLSRLGALFSE